MKYRKIKVSAILFMTLSLTVLQAQNVTDIEGNDYTTVTIGTQTWMGENLKTTKLTDGESIPKITDNAAWPNLATPAYCWYNNDETAHKKIYGALYNWYTVNTGKLCPTGWHIPSDDEWKTMIAFLGGAEEETSYRKSEQPIGQLRMRAQQIKVDLLLCRVACV
jgi:uncharacterized protein (TIGR02145 family)